MQPLCPPQRQDGRLELRGQKKALELYPSSWKGQGHDTSCLGPWRIPASLSQNRSNRSPPPQAVVHIIGTSYSPLWVGAGCWVLWTGLSKVLSTCCPACRAESVSEGWGAQHTPAKCPISPTLLCQASLRLLGWQVRGLCSEPLVHGCCSPSHIPGAKSDAGGPAGSWATGGC